MQALNVTLIIGFFTLGVCGMQPVLAQEASEDRTGGLSEIVVTAQKRAESAQRVPITIAVFDEATMKSFQIDDLESLAHAVPGLQYNFAQNVPQYTIRGITNFANGVWVDSAINLYIDGVYTATNVSSGFTFDNVERVEVLKGPQGTLFGRNALGGVISVITKDPQQEPSLDVGFGYGNFETTTEKFYGTRGIAPNLAADLSLYATDSNEGWGRNFYDGTTLHDGFQYSGRTKWLYTPGADTKVTFSADFDRTVPQALGNSTMNGVYPFVNIGPVHVGGFWDSYLPFPSFLDVKKYGASLKAEHDFGSMQFVSITAWSKAELARSGTNAMSAPFNPQNPLQGQLPGLATNGDQRFTDREITQELQLKSPDSAAVKWIGGLFLLDGSIDNLALRQTNTSSLTTTIDQQPTQSYAVFGQTTFPVFDRNRLTLGARYTVDHRSVSGFNYNAAGQVIPSSSASANPDPSHTWQKPTFTGIFDHDFSRTILGYVSYSRGFQSASYNISSNSSTPPVEPQTLDAYETGLKTTVLDNRLRVNTSIFYYKMHDLLVSQNIDGRRTNMNAAAATYKGVDLDVAFQALDNLTLTGAVAYLDPKYTDYENATFYGPNSNGSGAYTTFTADATGNQIATTETFAATVSATYQIPTEVGNFSIASVANYHSGIHFDAQGLLVQPSYTVVNESVSWTHPNKRWDLKLWSSNLGNTKYASYLYDNTPVMFMNVAPPRTYGIDFHYRWN